MMPTPKQYTELVGDISSFLVRKLPSIFILLFFAVAWENILRVCTAVEHCAAFNVMLSPNDV